MTYSNASTFSDAATQQTAYLERENERNDVVLASETSEMSLICKKTKFNLIFNN